MRLFVPAVLFCFFLFISCGDSFKMGFAPPGKDFEIVSFNDTCAEYLITIVGNNASDSIPVSITVWRNDSVPAAFTDFFLQLYECDSTGNMKIPLNVKRSGISLGDSASFIQHTSSSLFSLKNIPQRHRIRQLPDSTLFDMFDLNFIFNNPGSKTHDYLYMDCYSIRNLNGRSDTTRSGFLMQWQSVREYGGGWNVGKLIFCNASSTFKGKISHLTRFTSPEIFSQG